MEILKPVYAGFFYGKKMIKSCVQFCFLIFTATFAISNETNYPSEYSPPQIDAKFYVNYDQVMSWGGSGILFPFGYTFDSLFQPALEGVAKNGVYGGVGGYFGSAENSSDVAGYLLMGVAKVWTQDRFNDLPNTTYFNPKIGFDLHCLNLELNHYNDMEQYSKTSLGIRFRLTENCADQFAELLRVL